MKKLCLLLFYVCVFSIHSFAQNIPFEVCLDKINENTKWYYIKINNNYIGVDKQLELYLSDAVSDNRDKYLWAFIDAGKGSFYLTNRYLGDSYRLNSNSSSSVIKYGDLAVMKQGNGRKMNYKIKKNGDAGIYTKSIFNTYLGIYNSQVGFIDTYQEADIIVDFAKTESEIIKEDREEELRKAEEEARKQLYREKIKAMPSEAILGTWEELAGSAVPGNKQIFRKDGSKGCVSKRALQWKIGGIMCNFTLQSTWTKTELWRKVDDNIIIDTKSVSDITTKVLDVDYSNMTIAQKNKVKAGIPAFERLATKEARDDWARVMKPNSSTYNIVEITEDYMYLYDKSDGMTFKLRKIK